MELKKPNFRNGEDEDFCCAKMLTNEERTRESAEDYILPDYLPDVKKVAAVFPQALIKGRFMGSGTLEYDGEVRYKILYISEDGEYKSVTFLTGFEDKIGNGEYSEDCLECIVPVCRAASVRMINPRKLNIRSQNGARVTVYKRACCMPQLYGALCEDDEKALECALEKVKGMNVLSLYESGLTLSEDLSFDAVMPTAEEIVFSNALLDVQECRVSEGEAQFRGTADVCCLISAQPDAAGVKQTIRLDRTLNFTQTVKNEKLHEGGVCSAMLEPVNCEFRLSEDEFGQKRVIEFDMTYLCDLTVFYPKEVTVMTDGFSTANETDLTVKSRSFSGLQSPLKGSFSVNESVRTDLPENEGYTLDSCFLVPELRGGADEDGKYLLSGSCAVTLLVKDSAGAADVRRVSVPLRFKTDVSVPENTTERLFCRASGVRCRLDKNILSCDFEIGFCGYVVSSTDLQTVESLRILKEARSLPGKRGSIILCYPAKEDTAFSIAKKYGVSPKTVEQQLVERNSPVLIYRN